MNIKKITTGFVIQTFNPEGKLLEQNFTAGDQCDWENEDGEPIESENFYHSFDMVENSEHKDSQDKLANYIVNDEVEIRSYRDWMEEGKDPRNHVYYHALIASGAGDEADMDLDKWKEEVQEQQRRDEKNGLRPEHEDIAN